METHEKTLERLRILEGLYRDGYQSDVIDRSLGKLLDLERASARRHLEELDRRLHGYEEQYQMSSSDFYRRFRRGELGDDVGFVEWSAFFEMRLALHDRLDALEAELDKTSEVSQTSEVLQKTCES